MYLANSNTNNTQLRWLTYLESYHTFEQLQKTSAPSFDRPGAFSSMINTSVFTSNDSLTQGESMSQSSAAYEGLVMNAGLPGEWS